MNRKRKIEESDFERYISLYLRNKERLDTSEMYRHYYARIRMKPWTNPKYALFIRNELDFESHDDIACYLTYSNWFEESDYPDSLRKGTIEGYAKYAHKIAMTKIHKYRRDMVTRINKIIVNVRNIIYNLNKKIDY